MGEFTSNERDMVELTAIANDSDLVANMLQDALNKCDERDSKNHHKMIADVMSNIHGEYAFILFVPSKSHSNWPPCIYYGRDPLGRRSLLINKSIDCAVLLSSVAVNASDSTRSKGDGSNIAQEWVEIPPAIVHRIDLLTGNVTSEPIPRVINKNISQMDKFPKQSLPKSIIETDTIEFMKLLDRAVERRVAHAPSSHAAVPNDASVAVLFSGGIDSVVLAALSHRHVPANEPIDLLNVSFFDDSVNGNSQSSLTSSPDRLAAILSYVEMQSRFPERKWRFIAVDVKYHEVLDYENRIRRLIHPLVSTMDFNIATAFWFAARGIGRLLDPKEVEDVHRELQAEEKSMDNNASESLPSQQPLLRFATHDGRENQTNRVASSKSAQPCIREGCCRRSQSGCIFQSCKFCCGKFQGPISSYLGTSARLCPTHNHQQNVKTKGGDAKTYTKKKNEDISNDQLRNDNTNVTSSAKILLSGVGADEQLAGYGRHRTTFQRGGYDALQRELKMEVGRLWTRNLGRDDRCLSDHGKEARFPFLDEDVVAYLERLPVDRKCNMLEAPGVGDKLLLREVARMIGVHSCSNLVKRAIQFGSRIAKVSDRCRFGSCRQATGTADIRSNHREKE
jgi:asparagine synthetase B (glutamine-hydrolysing)